MTILEQLASMTSPVLAERIAEHRRNDPSGESAPRGPAAAFDNRKTWDNWTKKEPPCSKKTHYFRKK